MTLPTHTLPHLAAHPSNTRIYDSQAMAYLHGVAKKFYNLSFCQKITLAFAVFAPFVSIGGAVAAGKLSTVRREGFGPCNECTTLKSIDLSSVSKLSKLYAHRADELRGFFPKSENITKFNPEALQKKIDEVNAQFTAWGLEADTQPVEDENCYQGYYSSGKEQDGKMCFATKSDVDVRGWSGELGYVHQSIQPPQLTAAKNANQTVSLSSPAKTERYNEQARSLSANMQTYAAINRALFGNNESFTASIAATVYSDLYNQEKIWLGNVNGEKAFGIQNTQLQNISLLPLDALPCKRTFIQHESYGGEYSCAPLFNSNSTFGELKNMTLSIAPHIPVLDLLHNNNGSAIDLQQHFNAGQIFIDLNKTALAPFLPQMQYALAMLNQHATSLRKNLTDAFVSSGAAHHEVKLAKNQSIFYADKAEKLKDARLFLHKVWLTEVGMGAASALFGAITLFYFPKYQKLLRKQPQVQRLQAQSLAIMLTQPSDIPRSPVAPTTVIEEV